MFAGSQSVSLTNLPTFMHHVMLLILPLHALYLSRLLKRLNEGIIVYGAKKRTATE